MLTRFAPPGVRAAVVATFAACSLAVSSHAFAQQPTPSPGTPAVQAAAGKEEGGFFKSLVVNLGDDVKHMPRMNSLYWLAAGSGLALAVHPADDSLNQHLAGDFADKFFAPGKVIGSFPFVIGTGITTYLVGRIGDHPRGKHLGMDLIEATLLSEGITQGIKYSVRRERPIAPDGSQASGYAFPSGHATVTFAAATVLQQHLGWKAAVPTYLVASVRGDLAPARQPALRERRRLRRRRRHHHRPIGHVARTEFLWHARGGSGHRRDDVLGQAVDDSRTVVAAPPGSYDSW